MSGASEPRRYADMIDLERGLVDRRVFVDEAIYRRELEVVFGRCWLYLAHESELPNPGDYVNVLMGTTSVILARARDGKLRAFLNSCRHRGNSVCRADRGTAKTFICPYHGWSYDLTGRLVGLPGAKELYAGSVDRAQWGLVPVAQVASYKGLVFGCFDPEAPSLEEYLGDMRWGLDLLLDQGDMVAVPGTMRWSMECNWKMPAENTGGDTYHVYWSHRSAFLAGHEDGDGATHTEEHAGTWADMFALEGFTMVTAYGHGFNADYASTRIDETSPLTAWRRDPEVQRKMGAFRRRIHRANQNVFPNLLVATGSRELVIRNPVGPTRTELRKTLLVDRNADPAAQRAQIRASNRHFGPAGMFEQEDGENWEQSTQGARGPIADRYPLHYGMGVGRGAIVDDGQSPPRIDSLMNEHYQLWMYRAWAEFMDAPSWSELARSHSRPKGVV